MLGKEENAKNNDPVVFRPGPVAVPPGFVAVPLDEYKSFLEFQFKGPTMEVPVEEYRRLKEENVSLRDLLEEEKRINTVLNARECEARERINSMTSIEEIIKREVGKIEVAVRNCIKESKNVVTESDTTRTTENSYTAKKISRRSDFETEAVRTEEREIRDGRI